MKILKIEGMHCMNCVARVEKALCAIDGVSVKVDLENGTAAVEGCENEALLKETVEDLGFDVTSVN